jgi:uncharacterized protein YbcI
VSRLTRGTIEAQVANAIVQFQREQQGRGPADVRVHLIGDLILVRCTGIFTLTETRLAVSEEGRRLIKSARQELRVITRADQENLIAGIVDCNVIRSYGDVDVEAAEQMEVFVLEADLEKRLLRQELDALSGLNSRQKPDRSQA